MINIYEVNETNNMIEHEKLDVRTITLGISLLDCVDSNLDALCDKIYRKITSLASNLVATGRDIERDFGIPIVNKRISVTPISLVGGAACKSPEDFVTTAKTLDKAAKESGHVGIISVGWDPGMFSLNRLYANAILPGGSDYTFWGKGVSQGHSDAIRRIKGVKDARQYTIPVEDALAAVRSGAAPELTTRQKHTRECFVVAEEGADLKAIEEAIVTMPNYFADYDTTVHFISQEELIRDHAGIPHGGFVIRTGRTGWNDENSHVIEYSLKLDSNPEFTASVIVAYARAAYRLGREGQSGCKTVFDIAPAYLSAEDGASLRKRLL